MRTCRQQSRHCRQQRLRRRLDRKAEEMRALKDCLMALREDRRKERASQQQKLKASEGRAQALAKTLAACHKEIRQVHELHSAAAARQQSEIEEWKQLASRGTDDLELARTKLQDAKAELTRRAEAIAEWEKEAGW